MDKHYTVNGGPKGWPILGVTRDLKRDQFGFIQRNAAQYGDIVPFKVLGRKLIQVNHPDLIRRVLMENNKNYIKAKTYARFEEALGKGLLTSNGEKWRRDRQKIQPMFKREQIEGYYFDVANAVSEKYKNRWLSLIREGAAELDITSEMSAITIEIILRVLFGKDNLSESDVRSLHHSYGVLMDYLKYPRIIPKLDMRKVLRTRKYHLFQQELAHIKSVLKRLLRQYKSGAITDKYNMLALLIEAQKDDLENFSELDIMDHSISMVFAGFETTSTAMQWMWYALSINPEAREKLRADIICRAPYALQADSNKISFESINAMEYMAAAFKETIRMYPPFWITSRDAVEDDYFGDFKVEAGTTVLLPQIVMHYDPKWWKDPQIFRPERFSGNNEDAIDPGVYFPFSQGPRKCSGYRFAEMETAVVFTKLLPFFDVAIRSPENMIFDHGIVLKSKFPLLASIKRAQVAQPFPEAV